MEIYFRKTNEKKTIEIEREKTVEEILKDLNLKVCESVVLKNSEIVIEEEVVNNSDKLEIVTSGSHG